MNIRVNLSEATMKGLGYRPQVTYEANGETFSAGDLAAWHGSAAALLLEALKGGALDEVRRLAIGDQLEGHMAAQQAWAEAHKGDLDGAIGASEQVLGTVGSGYTLVEAIASSEGVGWPGAPGRTWIDPIWGEGAKAEQLSLFGGGDPSHGGALHKEQRTDSSGRTQTKWVKSPTQKPSFWGDDNPPSETIQSDSQASAQHRGFHKASTDKHSDAHERHTRLAAKFDPDSKGRELHERAAALHRQARDAHRRATDAHSGTYRGATSAQGLSRQADIESHAARDASYHADKHKPQAGGGGGGGAGGGGGHGTHALSEKLFGWYPNLRGKWGDGVELVGDYAHPGAMQGEVVVRNKHGDEMAVQAKHLSEK